MIITLILFALAATRISHIVAEEDGPFEVFKSLRDFCNGQYECGIFWRFASELLTCVKCLSVWVGMAMSAVFMLTYGQEFPHQWITGIVIGFAFSAVAVLLKK